MNTQVLKRAAFVLALFAFYIAGLAVRRHVMDVQIAIHGMELPFTMESALHFRRIQHLFEGRPLPERDPFVQYPEGIVVRETDTIGGEYVYAALARLFPARMTLESRLRWIQPAWFCLGIPLMACWIWFWKKSVSGALIAAGFYAVALSSVIRSTGQELSHENFAWPWLLAHLACETLASASRPGRRRWLIVLASALSLGVALISWDLIQFYVLLWMIVRVVQSLRVREGGEAEISGGWMLHMIVLMALGAINPYLRRHGFLWSPAMLLGYGVILGAGVRAGAMRGMWSAKWGRRPVLWMATLAPLLLGLALPGVYRESYGHFGALLLAKLRFLNHKPADPSLLTFDQRIMWVPALHSANWSLTWTLFPAILSLSLAAIPILVLRASDRSDSKFQKLLFFYVISLAAFVFFVRFHVFLVVFAAVMLGLWAAAAGRMRNPAWRWVTVLLLFYGMWCEAAHVVRKADVWGRGGVYYAEMDELADWLSRNAAPDPVLANFGLSGTILAYGGCPIVLHPKFESPDIRKRVREYGEQLFKGTESSFREWADGHGAEYYVYAMGEFATVAPDRQMRYFVDALNPPADCPARLFEFSTDGSPYFRFLWGNRKYRVFKILTRGNETLAARYGEEARAALEKGLLNAAEYAAVEALRLNPRNREAQQVLKHVGALRDQGFQLGTESE